MMNAAMRIKTCMTFMRFSLDAIREHSRDVARRSHFAALPMWTVCTAGALAAIVAAAASTAAMSGFITPANGPRADRVSEASQDCSARYAALLDLAELARRDGKSSEVVVRGLSERGGALSGCLQMGSDGHAGR